MEIKPREGATTNPYGANQFTLDPRQRLCWELYTNPRSETFGNGTQSAIKAGYEPDYADQITTVEWFKGKLRRLNMLGKAEKVLEETLDMPINTLEWEGHGEGREQVVVTNPQLIKIKQDTAKFLAERLGKAEYSTRTELTGEDGGAIKATITGMKIIQDGDSIQNKEPETTTSG